MYWEKTQALGGGQLGERPPAGTREEASFDWVFLDRPEVTEVQAQCWQEVRSDRGQQDSISWRMEDLQDRGGSVIGEFPFNTKMRNSLQARLRKKTAGSAGDREWGEEGRYWGAAIASPPVLSASDSLVAKTLILKTLGSST